LQHININIIINIDKSQLNNRKLAGGKVSS